MAKKVELEHAFRECSARISEALFAEKERDFDRLLLRALDALPFLRDCAAYLRRHQNVEAPRLVPIELIRDYAPLMFNARAIDLMESWINEGNRAERKVYPDLIDQVRIARERLLLAIRVFPSLKPRSSISPSAEAERMMSFWSSQGLVSGPSGRQCLVTHPDAICLGKCFSCGHIDRARWIELLAPRRCPHCRTVAEVAIVGRSE